MLAAHSTYLFECSSSDSFPHGSASGAAHHAGSIRSVDSSSLAWGCWGARTRMHVAA